MTTETFNQLLKQAAQSACNFLKEVAKGMKNVAVSLHEDYSNAQKIKLNQIRQSNNIMCLQQIRWELYCVFHGREYPYLQVVNVVDDIVPICPRPPQVGILLENPQTPPRPYMLRQVADKMNYDIACFRQWILANYSLQEAWMLYPCIMAGMYIADITANGIYAVLTIGFLQ